jgi:hypothetical protein
MKKKFILLSLFCFLILEDAVPQNFLSNLSATKNSPIYSTYAASLERSEFIVDQGYQLVKYFYYPFLKIRVEVFFLVYSSRIAIQDIKIINEGENLFNVLLIDTTANSYGGYSSLGDNPLTAREVMAQNYCVGWGKVRHSDNSPCLHTPPNAQQIIFHNDRLSEILTEEAPKWGDVDPNIPGNGYQGCELGNFQKPQIAIGDSFTVLFTCAETNKQGIGKGKITSLPAPIGIRTDIFLNNFYPTTPQYLIFRGLLRYGYVNEARQLVEKILQNVIHQLKTNHNFWELYSPDYLWAGWNKTYIWTGIIARFFIDINNLPTKIESELESNVDLKFDLYQNFPNPFSARGVSLVYGQGYASGVYFYTLTVNNFTQTNKMILLK